ncbi:MAG: hypothetical protein WC905_04025, partial [Patescibacteria group bacterium]
MLKTPIKSPYFSIFWVFFYLFLFCLLMRFGFSYLDPDLGWHLKVGEEISLTHQLPSFNHYNYTFSGSWVDHEWLSNVLLYNVYHHVGYVAVVGLFALIIIVVLVGLQLFIKKHWPQVPGSLIAVLQVFGVIAASPHSGVRIQELGWLFLFCLLLILDNYERRRKWKTLLFIIPLLYFWSCLHGSFLIGFFLLIAWGAVKIGERIIKWLFPAWPVDTSNVLSVKQLAIFVGLSSLAGLATLFTPYRLELYSFLGGYANTAYLTKIQEWLSQFFYPFFYWQLAYLAIAILAVISYVYEVFRNKTKKIDLWPLFLTFTFIVLSFKSRRHFPLMFVATLPFLATVYADIFSTLRPRSRPVKSGLNRPNSLSQAETSRPCDLRRSRWLSSSWLPAYLLFCLALAIGWQVTQMKFVHDPFRSFCRDYPCGAYDFLIAHPQYQEARMFNNYGWGGYLIWMMPGKQIFIDGRLPQVEYAGRTLLEEYLDFFKPDDEIPKRLDEYGGDLFLISS